MFDSDVPQSYTQMFQTFEHIYLKIMGPIYTHLVALREGDAGIFPDHKFMGLVKISLARIKKYTFKNILLPLLLKDFSIIFIS